MSLQQKSKSEALREELESLSLWIDSPSCQKWVAAREEEVRQFNEQIAYSATSWEEVVRLRAFRENTVILSDSFEEIRELLKTKLDAAVEHETQIAAESRN